MNTLGKAKVYLLAFLILLFKFSLYAFRINNFPTEIDFRLIQVSRSVVSVC
jgi:hypothetical protein